MASRYNDRSWQYALAVAPPEVRERMKRTFYRTDDGFWIKKPPASTGRKSLGDKSRHKDPPQVKENTRRRNKANATGASKEATAFWKKTYQRRAELKDRSNSYIQGLRAGIVEDKKINKTELPGWTATSSILQRQGQDSEAKKPASAPAPPEIDNEARRKIRKEVHDKRHRAERRAERGNRPAPRPRVKISASAKAQKWRTDFDAFKKGIGLALCNVSYRYEICRFIENEGTDAQKRFAETKGIKWRKWWVTPKNPKTGNEYKQINSLEGTCKQQGINLNDEKRRYREKYKHN